MHRFSVLCWFLLVIYHKGMIEKNTIFLAGPSDIRSFYHLYKYAWYDMLFTAFQWHFIFVSLVVICSNVGINQGLSWHWRLPLQLLLMWPCFKHAKTQIFASQKVNFSSVWLTFEFSANTEAMLLSFAIDLHLFLTFLHEVINCLFFLGSYQLCWFYKNSLSNQILFT